MPDASDYRHGPRLMPDGTVRFRLWAPASESVILHVDGASLPMQRKEAGWFEAAHECAAGAVYWYEPAGVGKVPDPASRLQQTDVDGPSVLVDHFEYEWVNKSWRGRSWCDALVYEAHVGLMGGFEGVRRRLPELADLGITAVELMPVGDFPGPRNWGYDGVLPYAPDRAYGTPSELKRLIDEAHGLGVMMLLDVVYNHFGPVGNYLPSYAPNFFRHDVETPWGPAIDFREPAVSAFFADNALYWLREYRFDGLRFDAVHAIIDKEEWLGKLAPWLRSGLPADRHTHLILENDDNTASLLRHGFDAQWNDDAHHVVHHLLTGESHGYYRAYSQRPTEKLARALAQGFIYQGEPSPAHDGRPRGEPSYMLPPTAFIFFLQNHDQVGNRAWGERITVLCRDIPGALEAAVALQLLSPFIPLIFMGEERGSDAPFFYFTSFSDPEFAQAVTEGHRSEFADFYANEEDIPDPNSIETWERSRVEFDAEESRARRWLNLYRQLLSLRREHIAPCLSGASCETVEVLGEGCVLARWVLNNGHRLTLYCNLSDRPVKVAASLRDRRETIFHESRQGATVTFQSGMIPPFCTLASMLSSEGNTDVRSI